MSLSLLACRRLALGLALCGVLVAAGCTGSRWARSNRDYAKKYSQHSDNVVQMGKQAIDARHVAGDGGHYAGVAARGDSPFALGAQVGQFVYPPGLNGAVETRVGLAGLVAEGDRPVTGGIELGARVQSPTRLAPFVGVGVYGGLVPEFNIGSGHDSDGYFDGDDGHDTKGVAALVPEAGAHFWITPQWRLTASAAYYVTSNNDESAFPTVAISLAYLDAPRAPSAELGSRIAASVDQQQPAQAPPAPAPAEFNGGADPPVLEAYQGLDLSAPAGETVRR